MRDQGLHVALKSSLVRVSFAINASLLLQTRTSLYLLMAIFVGAHRLGMTPSGLVSTKGQCINFTGFGVSLIL